MTEALAAAIEAFRSESFVDAYDEEVEVSALTHPDVAYGNCFDVSEAFLDFLGERGLVAEVIHTTDHSEWGYEPTNRLGLPAERGGEHYAVLVDGLMIDWTACQFRGESALPVVKEAQ